MLKRLWRGTWSPNFRHRIYHTEYRVTNRACRDAANPQADCETAMFIDDSVFSDARAAAGFFSLQGPSRPVVHPCSRSGTKADARSVASGLGGTPMSGPRMLRRWTVPGQFFQLGSPKTTKSPCFYERKPLGDTKWDSQRWHRLVRNLVLKVVSNNGRRLEFSPIAILYCLRECSKSQSIVSAKSQIISWDRSNSQKHRS